MKKIKIGLYFLFICIFLVSQTMGIENKPRSSEKKKVKNLIILIGDGMGPQAMGLLTDYAQKAPNSIYKGRKSGIEKVMDSGVIGISSHNPFGSLVTDSAASASQMATGVLTGSEMVGLDKDGNPVETVLEKAKKMGKSTGLVTDTRVTHATPAGFAAHQAHRTMENEIAVDMLYNDVTVMLGGGIRYWIPRSVNKKGAKYNEIKQFTGGTVKIKSKRKDDRNLLKEAQEKGYQLAFNKNQLQEAQDAKLLGLFKYSIMPDAIMSNRTRNDPNRTIPNLKEMTVKALEILTKNPKGFFLMVEAGQIDWAGHYNDAGDMLHELLAFDEVVDYVYEWAKNRDDTLVIVTADHETGSFGFSYSRRNLPAAKSLPGKSFSNRDYKPNYNFGALSILDKLYNQKMSFEELFFGKFDALPEDKKTPQKLVELVNATSEFKIDIAAAERILATEPNEYYVEGHSYLGTKKFPKVNDFKEFYVYGDEIRCALLGRELGKKQNIVWATGTHTSTPVVVIAHGPHDITSKFSKLMHHTEMAQLYISAQ